MAWMLECKNGQESFDCCGGGTGNELFQGLQVTDDDGGVTLIYSPYEVHYSVLQSFVYVSDYKGNRKRIDLSNTSFSSLTALLEFISDCQACACGGDNFAGPQSCFHQAFIDVTADYVTVTAAQLPDDLTDYPYLVEVVRDGGKSIYGTHYAPDPATNRIYFDGIAGISDPRTLEGEDVEVIICRRKEWVYQNNLNYSGSSLPITVGAIPTATSDWIHEEFLNASGDDVTLTLGTLPTLFINLNLRVYRDGGKGIYEEHFKVDGVNNKIVFNSGTGIGDPRTLEGEHVQVFYRETDVPNVLRVFRDGGKGIYGTHFLIDESTNSIVPTRAYENENIQVYLRAL